MDLNAGRSAVQDAGAIRRGSGRVRGTAAVAVAVLALVLTSCSGDADGAGKQKPGDGRAKGPSEAVVKISPKNGADDVGTADALKVTAQKGKLTRVKVEDSDGEAVPGKFSAGATSWSPEGHLATDTKYTVEAVARDAQKRTATRHARFTTLTPGSTFIGNFTPEDGSEVGVGMPVSLVFNHSVSDREAVEKSVSVTADPKVDIEGHWFGHDRLDFRPEEYWKAGTDVTLALDLDGVEGSDGVYGTQHKSVHFTVGRSQVSVVDAAKKSMKVTRDGKKIRTIPISAGSPDNTTYNGRMVISEKHKVIRMDGDTVGFGDAYDIKDVPHAMRLSTSGTFIHGNYWAGQAAFGSVNTSHGCIGMFDQRGGNDSSTPAAWFFRKSMNGDVVEVKNSKDKTVAPDNGLNGWNMDWDKWTAAQH